LRKFTEEEVEETVREIVDIAKGILGSKKRLFAYSMLSDMYGTRYEDNTTIISAYRRGDDLKAYDKLTGIITANAERHENGLRQGP
jgi:hypothetical protein